MNRAQPLNPATIIAEHQSMNDYSDHSLGCWVCGPNSWPCLPYRLAAALADAERRGAEKALREAADIIESISTEDPGAWYPGMVSTGWLIARADEIAQGRP